MARGKALVAKLRAQPGVRDAEALAASLGRIKRLRSAGVPHKKAVKLAGKKGGLKEGSGKNNKKDRDPTAGNRALKKKMLDDDDPFNEDFGPNEKKSKEDRQQDRMEAKLIRDQEKADRSKLYNAIQEQGGLKTRDDLREEYAGIPNTFKRKDGLGGDEMAEYLGMYYPELGIEDERDLIDYLAA